MTSASSDRVASFLRQLAMSGAMPQQQQQQQQQQAVPGLEAPPAPAFRAVLQRAGSSGLSALDTSSTTSETVVAAAAAARSQHLRQQLAEMQKQTSALGTSGSPHAKLVEEAFRQHELQIYLEESQAGALLAKARDDPRPFKCTFLNCTKAFKEKKVLRKHLLTHQPKRFHCAYPGCHKSFYERAKLKRHNLVHTGEKNFVCTFEGCNKRFALKANLQTHFRVHSGDRPYPCPFPGCNKRFTQTSGRNSHYKTHLHQRKRKFSESSSQSSDITEPHHDGPPPSPLLVDTNENRNIINNNATTGAEAPKAGILADQRKVQPSAVDTRPQKVRRVSTAEFMLNRSNLSTPIMQRTPSAQSVASCGASSVSSCSNCRPGSASLLASPASVATTPSADFLSHMTSNASGHRHLFHKLSAASGFMPGMSSNAARLASPVQADASPLVFPLQPGNEAPTAGFSSGAPSPPVALPLDAQTLKHFLLGAGAPAPAQPQKLSALPQGLEKSTSDILSILHEQQQQPSAWGHMLRSMWPDAAAARGF